MGIEAGNYRSPSRYFLRKLHQWVSEFPWIWSKNSLSHGYPENRLHNKPAAATNWLGVIFFYVALVAIAYFTLKWYKRNEENNDDDEDENRSSGETRHHAQSISSIEQDPTTDQQLPKQKFTRKEAGDSPSTPRTVDSSSDYQAFLDFVESINMTNSRPSLNHESNNRHDDPSRKISLNRIKNQRKSHHPQRSKLADKDWYVRRTRSGQVYGRYPVF